MMDDFTLYNTTNTDNFGSTYIIGTDWTGRCVYLFSLDGTYVRRLQWPNNMDIYEPASVRWGRGPGFDDKSLYVSESGGLTRRVNNRRVIQYKMEDFEF
jgi:hypothetical protein